MFEFCGIFYRNNSANLTVPVTFYLSCIALFWLDVTFFVNYYAILSSWVHSHLFYPFLKYMYFCDFCSTLSFQPLQGFGLCQCLKLWKLSSGQTCQLSGTPNKPEAFDPRGCGSKSRVVHFCTFKFNRSVLYWYDEMTLVLPKHFAAGLRTNIESM